MGMVLLALLFGVIVQRKSPVWGPCPDCAHCAKWLAFASLALWIERSSRDLRSPRLYQAS